MTSMASRLTRTGVWYITDLMSAPEAAGFAQRVESLGYSALWLPDTVGRDPFSHITYLADRTESLIFATGIASIFHRHPGAMKQAQMTLAEQTGNRFVLGLGVSHEPIVAGLRGLDYSRPLSKMHDYLLAMDAAPYRDLGAAGVEGQEAQDTGAEWRAPRLLAALGPKMLALSAEHADGAHPYWSTPEHTAQARAILGPDKLLCVEQKVVLCADAGRARDAARTMLAIYDGLPNYSNNWNRLGFTDEEIARRDDRFVDAVVAWGDADAIRSRVQAHYDAGATHVCIQPLSVDGFGIVDWNLLEELAPGS